MNLAKEAITIGPWAIFEERVLYGPKFQYVCDVPTCFNENTMRRQNWREMLHRDRTSVVLVSSKLLYQLSDNGHDMW